MEANLKEDFATLRKRFEDANQGHIFKYYEEYTEEEKESFNDQLRGIDLVEVDKLYKEVC